MKIGASDVGVTLACAQVIPIVHIQIPSKQPGRYNQQRTGFYNIKNQCSTLFKNHISFSEVSGGISLCLSFCPLKIDGKPLLMRATFDGRLLYHNVTLYTLVFTNKPMTARYYTANRKTSAIEEKRNFVQRWLWTEDKCYSSKTINLKFIPYELH